MAEQPKHVTQLLEAINTGRKEAWEELLTLIYDELRRLAGAQMRHERPGHTLQRTALVNEACMRLLGGHHGEWKNRAHFFGAAAEAMRRILVDYARRRKAEKRGGQKSPVSLDEQRDADIEAFADDRTDALDLEALDVALAKMDADENLRDKCAVVKLRCFAGLTLEDAALALGKSLATVKRDWTFARAWLYREMTKDKTT